MIFDPADDKLKEECGIVGVYGIEDAATLTVLGLHALQHRGQEATGIVTFDGAEFHAHRASEMVSKAYSNPAVIARLQGMQAIGHNRYSTSGDTSARNIQPLHADLSFGGMAIAHNGNLTNAQTLRDALVARGSIFQSTSDTEVIVHLVALSQQQRPVERLIDALKQVEGAFSIVVNIKDAIIGARDPHGVRPLVLGQLDSGYVLASESCALDIMGATYIRDIEPGELVMLDKNGIHSQRPFAPQPSKFCIFEYIYFARPDSMMGGRSVYEIRKNIGAELSLEAPCPDADLVVPVPDSGVPAAIGFANKSGIAFDLGIIRSHYIGRTFIQPGQHTRNLGVKMKHNVNAALIKGKKVVLVDDSIVRGTTSRKIVEMLRAAGAAEIHMRISSPPSSHSCFYGIDTPSTNELMAHRMNVAQIREYIGAESLAYISIDGLYRAVGEARRNNNLPQYCDACFTGEYALPLTDQDKTAGTVIVPPFKTSHN